MPNVLYSKKKKPIKIIANPCSKHLAMQLVRIEMQFFRLAIQLF